MKRNFIEKFVSTKIKVLVLLNHWDKEIENYLLARSGEIVDEIIKKQYTSEEMVQNIDGLVDDIVLGIEQEEL